MYNLGEIQPDNIVVDAVAGGAISAGQVVVANASTSKFTASAGAKPTGAVGIAITSAAAEGAAVKVALDGRVAAIAGGTIKKFNLVSADSNGKIEAATVDTDYVLGFALEDASSGDAVLIKLAPVFTNIDTNT